MSEYILTEKEKHLIDMAMDSVDTLIDAFPKVLLRLDNLESRMGQANAEIENWVPSPGYRLDAREELDKKDRLIKYWCDKYYNLLAYHAGEKYAKEKS